MVRHAGAAPAPAVWKTAVLAVTPMTRKWWLRPVSRRTLLVFSEALIYLSYTASGPSARYRAAVSRLSGEGSAFELRRNEEWSPDEVTLLGLPDVSRPLSF
jgi:hypothetical protein